MHTKQSFLRLDSYIMLIALIGITIFSLNLPPLTELFQYDVLLFLLFGIIAANISITINQLDYSLLSPLSIFFLFTLNLKLAVLICSLSEMSYLIVAKKNIKVTLFNFSQMVISVYAAGIFLYGFYDGKINLPVDFTYVIPTILILHVVNYSLVTIYVSLKMTQSLKNVIKDQMSSRMLGEPLYFVNGLLMYICYQGYGFWGLLLVAIPLCSIYLLLKESVKAVQHKEDSHYCSTTTLKNKRCFDDWIENEFSKAIQKNTDISFAIIDLDNFKRINDNFGHNVGDQVLKEFGLTLRDLISETDLIFRYGGEEFIIIFPGLKTSEANTVMNRLHDVLKEQDLVDGLLKITFSAGIASLDRELFNDRNLNSARELIRRADMAMYDAKKSGKNQTKFFVA